MSAKDTEPGVLAINPPRIPNATDPITPYPPPLPGVYYVGLAQSAFTLSLTRDPTRKNAALVLADPLSDDPANQYETLALRVNNTQVSSQYVEPEDQNGIVQAQLPQAELNEGLNILELRYIRASGNFNDSRKLGIQYHRNLPGGNDVPGTGDHPDLHLDFASQLGSPPVIGPEEFANGLVRLNLDYPFKRAYDTIKFEINNVPFFFTVQPGEENKPFVIIVTMEMYVSAGKPGVLTVSYTVTDQLGNPTHLRRWSRRISATVDPVDGELDVMGARVAAVQYWANKGASRYITALDARTGKPLRARWRYEGETQEVATAHFDDLHPEHPLHVRYGGRSVTIRPANFFGNGFCDLDNFNLAHSAFVALKDDGNVFTWGVPDNGGRTVSISDVSVVAWSMAAFAALKRDGSVVAWGNSVLGGEVPAPIAARRDIRRLCTAGQAIAALTNDNSVVAWGVPANGGQVPANIAALKTIRNIRASATAFTVQLTDGSLMAWGDASRGGVVPADIARLRNIAEVVNNHDSFAARLTNGTVVAWGNPDSGGQLISPLSNVARIISAGYAYVAHLDNGQIKTWGRPDWGGAAPASILALHNIIDIVGAGYAFAAILDDYRVVAWGNPDHGGEVPRAIGELRNVVQLAATNGAFAALCADGSVVTWGNSVWGGDSALVSKRLKDVVAIYSNSEAFVALTRTGVVITWGLAESGGHDTAAEYELLEEISYSASTVAQGITSEQSI
ncbi:hypothetical protein SAMN04488483_2683 [Pseudomonas helmanticensis]|uniref:Uncharacterized protein n=1 Tax=Pseudomonas helmanticensis TaxID=1471381 RepID=A0ACD2U679_9PSED|nr:hypothetical protein [Pseudomonas helmanticensis]SMQ25986.1 hypothetical protein SAMN04488483_2683 [Pseudomonas helmanticensis]